MSFAPVTTTLGEAAIKIGIVSVMLTTVIGLGSLLYYVFELSSQPSTLQILKSGRWSSEVKTSIQHLYTYLFLGIYNCLLFAFLIFSNDMLYHIFSSRTMIFVNIIVTMMIRNGESFAPLASGGFLTMQRLAWFWYTVFVGGLSSTTFFYGVQVVKISVHLTCIIVSLLVIMGLTAPYRKFYDWRDVLSAFETPMLIASTGTNFLPASSTLGALFFSISFYGGLIYFSMTFLCHAQGAHLAAAAEDEESMMTPHTQVFCALCKSIPILLDAISIFQRIMVLIPQT